MKKILLSGCNGHMGRVVQRIVSEHSNFEIVCGYDISAASATSYPVYDSVEEMLVQLGKSFELPNVIIDFSMPDGTVNVLKFAKISKTPIVIATTGIEKLLANIRKASEVIPIFQSANMSFEVALLNWVLQKIAPKLSDTDIEISEIHHNRKADTPSGTATLLAQSISAAIEEGREPIYGRNGKRTRKEIGISSIRGGNIPGTHTVYFLGESETFKITHEVHSRDVFALGAIKAAEFLLGKTPGLYSMEDLVK